MIVIPTYNEERFIEPCIGSLEEYISSTFDKKYSFTIMIAEDGSTDNTYRIIKQLATELQNISISHSSVKLGRGKAVKEAWRNEDADIYVFLDADMSVPIHNLNSLIDLCNDKKYDVVTGSRYLNYSRVNRPFLRKIISLSYNWIINLLFRTGIKDHQCGFKAVRRNARDVILMQSIFDDWFWDTEIFVIAKDNGMTVYEFPVEWQEKKGSKTPIIRLLKDIWIHGSGIGHLLLAKNLNPINNNSKSRLKP